MSRRWLVCVAAALGLFSAPLCAQQVLEVTTDGGRVAGEINQGVASWKGLPYAAPPIGDLRWRAPQSPAPWSGVRQATSFGNDCMQIPFLSDFTPLGNRPAEDCLYLNIWKPAAHDAPLPVMVWIHGGGFVNGGTAAPVYSGEMLARQGIMVVSVNYRLGRFGTFAHPGLTEEAGENGMVGNYGYLDILAALRWVQRNVRSFGGDPARVTIAGESAGGMAVHMLATSPLAKGLFAGAAIMSADLGRVIGGKSQAAAETAALNFAAEKGIAAEDPSAMGRLRKLSAFDIADGLNMMTLLGGGGRRETFTSPFPDGRLVVDAETAYEAGDFGRVPMMIGATDDDLGGRTGMMVTAARTASRLIARHGVPVYAYRFAYVAEWIGQPNAKHATDIPYFLNTILASDGPRASARDIATASGISGYLVDFVKTGNPNGGGRQNWPQYSAENDEIMIFDREGDAAAQKDPLGTAP